MTGAGVNVSGAAVVAVPGSKAARVETSYPGDPPAPAPLPFPIVTVEQLATGRAVDHLLGPSSADG
jgi:hypothetical protein